MATVLRSSPTTVVVSTSVLQIAAAQAARNTFTVFEQPSLSGRTAHPTSGVACDPTEDGSGFVGHTAIDWAGKGCYDPVSRRVMWASCGAGNMRAGGAAFNTHAVYSEASNAWTVSRGFQAPGESNTNPIGHMYDSNCIDVAGRRFYKKKFGAAEILSYDLDGSRWAEAFPSPSDEANYALDGGLDFVPGRASAGALWLISWRRSDNAPQLWEYGIAERRWSVLIAGGAFGSAPGSNTSLISFNPRAFGGTGGALVAHPRGTWTVRADSPTAQATSQAPRNLAMPHDGHVCRDPAGAGWLYACSDGYLYSCDGSAWTRRSPLPGRLGSPSNQLPFVMVPIDAYGVVWFVTSQGTGARAWIYKS